jgi:hypothetical protein
MSRDINLKIGESPVILKSMSNEDIMHCIPTNLSQLRDDSNHRLVTDIEKNNWNNFMNNNNLNIDCGNF